MAYLAGLGFLIRDAARDPKFFDNHLLSYLSQDYLQSAISIVVLIREGLINVCKRELRFLIEASVKNCYVQQSEYRIPISEKIEAFERELTSAKISIKNDLNLTMLSAQLRDRFHDEVGRLYGKTSSYVHLTPSQINERISAVQSGKTDGKESAADVVAFNELLASALACSLVLLFHAVPSYVAGDWFVEGDGSSVKWYFCGSKYLAEVDSFFDYKHERQSNLSAIQALRAARIEF